MPVVLVAAVAIIGIFYAIAASMFLRGSLSAYNYSFGSIFEWLNRHMRVPIPLPLVGTKTINLGSPFGVINGAIIDALQKGIDDHEKVLAYAWHAAEQMLRYTTEAIDILARETAQTFEWAFHVKLSRVIKWLAAPILLPLLLPKLLASLMPRVKHEAHKQAQVTSAAREAIPHREVKKAAHQAAQAVDTGNALAKTIAASAGSIAIPRPKDATKAHEEVTGLGRWAWRVNKRLHKLEVAAGATAMAVALANVWGVSPRCARSGGPIGKFARALCGMPSSLLNDLLGLLADVWIVENVCSLLPLLETAASDVGEPLVEALTVIGAGLCRGATPPGALKGPQAKLPDVLYGTLALGV